MKADPTNNVHFEICTLKQCEYVSWYSS